MVQEVPSSPNSNNQQHNQHRSRISSNRGVVSPIASATNNDQVMEDSSSISNDDKNHNGNQNGTHPTILSVPPMPIPTPLPMSQSRHQHQRNHQQRNNRLLNSSPTVLGNDASPSGSSSDGRPVVVVQNNRSIGSPSPGLVVGDASVITYSDWKNLFEEVRSGLDNKQGGTVGWKQSHESLGAARQLLSSFLANPRQFRAGYGEDEMSDVRYFIEYSMHKIIQILLDQQCQKLADEQRQCVTQALKEATLICAHDIKYLSQRFSSVNIESKGELDLIEKAMPPYQFVINPDYYSDKIQDIASSLFVTYQLFNKARYFYCSGNSKQRHGTHYWNTSNSTFDSAELRLSLIWKFQSMSGFRHLANVWHRILLSYKEGMKRTLLPTVDQMMAVLYALEDLCRDWDDFEVEKRQRSKKSVASQQLNSSRETKHDPYEDVQAVCNIIMHYLGTANEDEIKTLHNVSNNSNQSHHVEDLCSVRSRLYRIIDNLSLANPTIHWRLLTRFFTFWREFAYKFMSANSLLLRLQGWSEISELVAKATRYRPPPRSYQVVNAGVPFVNGVYEYSGKVDTLGYAILAGGSDIQYTYKARVKSEEGGDNREEVKCITLFKCTMRSNAKWWFFSEADEDQPGTDKDIDYYQQKSVKSTSSVSNSIFDSKHEVEYICSIPPRDNWHPCRNSREPAPSLVPINGLMVPNGEEKNTLEHQLGRWIVEKRVIEELVLGFDSFSVHREVVNRSLPVLQFLAGMNTLDYRLKYSDSNDLNDEVDRRLSEYALQPQHLQLAWKACLSKTDVAVSTEIVTLLVSLLPYLTENLAISLLDEVDSSLINTRMNSPRQQQQGVGDLIVVAEFCGVLVTSCTNSSKTSLSLMPAARRKVLQILWHLLMEYPYDPSNSTLPGSLEQIQKTLKQELSELTEDMKILRDKFLMKCLEALQNIIKSSQSRLPDTNGDQGKDLRVVMVTQFILQTCPTIQRNDFIAANDLRLPRLLFSETCSFMAYISRANQESVTSLFEPAVRSRFDVLQYVYSQNINVFLSVDQLKEMWEMCCARYIYQELMLELLQHLCLGNTGDNRIIKNVNRGQQAAMDAFKMLFCSNDAMPSWDHLTKVGYIAYSALYRLVEDENETKGIDNNAALDTLWRIYMTCQNGNVAKEVLRHLLAVYNAQKVVSVKSSVGIDLAEEEDDDKFIQKVKVARMQPSSPDLSLKESSNSMIRLDPGRAFLFRILDCLRHSIKSHDENLISVSSSFEKSHQLHLDDRNELAAERCVLLLHAALEWDASSGQSTSKAENKSVNILLLPSESKSISMDEVQHDIAHGHMSQSCYRNISVVIRRNHTGGKQQTERFTIKLHPIEGMQDFRRKVAYCTNHPIESMKVMLTQVPCSSGASTVSSGLQSQSKFNDGTEAIVVLTPTTPSMVNIESQPSVSHTTEHRTNTTQPVVFNAHNQSMHGPSSIASTPLLDLTSVFSTDNTGINYGEQLFEILLNLLEVLPYGSQLNTSNVNNDEKSDDYTKSTFDLVWDLLFIMPTNARVLKAVHSIALGASLEASSSWGALIRLNAHSSVYTMQTIEALLSPAAEPYLLYNRNHRKKYLILDDEKTIREILQSRSTKFRDSFISSGGFRSVLDYFCVSADQSQKDDRPGTTTMGYGVALRILKICLSGTSTSFHAKEGMAAVLDAKGSDLLNSVFVSQTSLLTPTVLRLLTIISPTLPDSALSTSLDLLSILLTQKHICNVFSNDLEMCSKSFVMRLLLWPTARIRHQAADVVLSIHALADTVLSWYIDALKILEYEHEEVTEFFKVLQSLIVGQHSISNEVVETNENSDFNNVTFNHLHDLCEVVCMKLALYTRPTISNNAKDDIDSSSLVLCGLLKALKALLAKGGMISAERGSKSFESFTNFDRWSSSLSGISSKSEPIVNLIGFIFNGFLLSENLISQSSSKVRPNCASTPICHCKESRQLGFEIIFVAASLTKDDSAKLAVITRMTEIIERASRNFRNKFGNQISVGAIDLSSGNNATNKCGTTAQIGNGKFSGLRNQGCTCYMNSLLQQLFMMQGLREKFCDAPLPSCLREGGNNTLNSSVTSNGNGEFEYERSLVGNRISLLWESGTKYEAMVQSFDKNSEMHTIIYTPLPSSNVLYTNQSDDRGQHSFQQLNHRNHSDPLTNENIESNRVILEELPEEFCLSEGRPGRETGTFDVVKTEGMDIIDETLMKSCEVESCSVNETEDQSAARVLLEELQRTFVYLSEQQGRCYDPKALVEASTCLKLEFDVWQQNDASEYAMKLFDRLELPLKRWAPQHFKFLTETFGLKQTKQKICKECGLKTNREETLMSIDLQIRGKSSVHESLSTFCEVDLMCGDNQVNCDRCKEKRDTVLRTAISQLPNVLILSLKRFDLDFTTFETVKLNSRCAFDQTLNLKQYTLDGIEARERIEQQDDVNSRDDDDIIMGDGEETKILDPLEELPDEDYEYELVGVLVHAGVAQGGHYYSYIKDRSKKESDNGELWYRFDDEDVTSFDPKNIETECFGGKIKKETKWPNGQVTTTESEQFANALMLFYEKVKPVTTSDTNENENFSMELESTLQRSDMISGYNAFQPDVDKTNATHSWQTFLFDSELQNFLKKMLSQSYTAPISRSPDDIMGIASPISYIDSIESNNWRISALQLSLFFFFDVLLHTVDRESRNLSDWTHTLVLALHHHKDGAKWFMSELVRRTSQVSCNWLRSYYIECPEQSARAAANKVFFNAFVSVISCKEEQECLTVYTQNMRERWNDIKSVDDARSAGASPMSLDSELGMNSSPFISSSIVGNTSTVGMFLSYISSLLEIAPRRWPFCSEICHLLKDLSWIKEEYGQKCVRDLLYVIQVPSLIICLIIRDEAPEILLKTFPGSCLSVEQSEILSRGVCDLSSSSHLPMLTSLTGIQNQTNSVTSAQLANFQVNTNDLIQLLEAICGILGIKGCETTPLIYNEACQESVSTSRTNSRNSNVATKLTPKAKAALTVIFNEFRNQAGLDRTGLSQSSIQKYMERCGFDNVHPQKIASLLSKYSTDSGEGVKINRRLSLEGFLAYYRDSSASNDSQVRSDLHTFGFRRDLSRRPEQIRMMKETDNVETSFYHYDNLESIALDVVSSRNRIELSEFLEAALNSFSFYAKAYNACESLAAYILASMTCNREIDQLLFDTLDSLNRAPTNWGGTETLNQCVMIFKVALSVRDNFQCKRIEFVMKCSETCAPHGTTGVGLLVAANHLSTRSSSQRFASEYRYADAVDRYIDVISDLYSKIDRVKQWMDERNHEWSWIHHWKQRMDPVTRGTILSDRDAESYRYGNRINSDSETGGFVPDSDEDDAEPRYSTHGDRGLKLYRNVSKSPEYIYVRSAGLESVNGAYKPIQPVDKVIAYERIGVFKSTQVMFTLYRWPMQGSDTKSWFISILPANKSPGSSSDIDLYASKGSDDIPPENGWREIKDHGIAPGPTITYSLDSPSVGDMDPSDSQDDDEIAEEDTSGDIPQIDQWRSNNNNMRSSLVQSDEDDITNQT